jgi:hypothetical protein
MKEFEKIVQYHLDNNLKVISPKFSKQLNANQKKELQNIIDLDNKLSTLRVKDSFGKNALKSTLYDFDSETKAANKSVFKSLKFAGSIFALVAIIAIGGGLSINSGNKSNPSANLNTSKVAANGSVDNLNNLNLADAQNDINLASQSQLDEAVSTELSAQSKVDEVINENFQ